MRVLKSGGPCPCCGQPIQMTDLDALRLLALAANQCDECIGIMYRQTSSGKIVPCDRFCSVKPPPCYKPDGDGCAYQIYGDENDEPIEKCKACPLCYSDKVRHTREIGKCMPLTVEELQEMDGQPVYVVEHGTSEGEWYLVDVSNEGLENKKSVIDFSTLGVLENAYRSPPEVYP